VADVELVKQVAVAIRRLQRGEIVAVRFMGLAVADAERRTLVRELVEDHRPLLGSDVVLRNLPRGDLELVRVGRDGRVLEIDLNLIPSG
jgi:hypothetical protein